jgi:hypothetical protein
MKGESGEMTVMPVRRREAANCLLPVMRQIGVPQRIVISGAIALICARVIVVVVARVVEECYRSVVTAKRKRQREAVVIVVPLNILPRYRVGICAEHNAAVRDIRAHIAVLALGVGVIGEVVVLQVHDPQTRGTGIVPGPRLHVLPSDGSP